jgi:hypothetical protein
MSFELNEILTEQFIPRVLPHGWHRTEMPNLLLNYDLGLSVIISVETIDNVNWLHVSASHGDMLPSWDNLKYIKDIFIGKERRAIQVFPPASEYVNINPYVLHLWCNLDHDILPDFRRPGGL